MTEALTADEKSRISNQVEMAANDVARMVESATVSSMTVAWFVIKCDESDVESVVSKVIRDSDVTLYKVERDDGFVSAKHNELV